MNDGGGARPRLQLALDDIALDAALRLGEAVRAHVDIIEIGTPFLLAEGMAPVRAFKARFPELEIIADTKIADAGEYEAELGFAAGADGVTVLGMTDLLTVASCLRAAARHGRRAVIDMIGVADLPGRIAALEAIGATDLAVHTGVDQQAAGRTPLQDLRVMKACSRSCAIHVAGGLTLDTLPDYLALGAAVVIVGSGIRHAPDPAAAARAFHDAIRRFRPQARQDESEQR